VKVVAKTITFFRLWSPLNQKVFDYDKDSLIFNDGREDVDNPVQKGTYYYLMSKTDGGMRPLPFHVKYRITNRFRIRLRNGDRQGVISCMFSVKPLLKNGDEVILSEFSNDTVFSYGKEGAKPLLVRTPAPRSTFPLKLMSVSACSRRFLFLDVIEKVYRRNIKKLDGDSFVYDYREKEIFTPVLVNSDFIPELPVEIDNMNGSFPKYAGASSIHSREFRDKITIDQHRSKDLLFAVIVDKRVSVQLLDIPSIHFLYHIQKQKTPATS
jgi:hypothetical protein